MKPRQTLTNLTPPSLETLDTKPTWHNRGGRVDRSACLVINVSTFWRTIPDDHWRYLRTQLLSSASIDNRPPMPDRRVARRLRGKPDRIASLSLTAHDLWVLHRFEPPRRIQGDQRTHKANALSTAGTVVGDDTLNPNRGVGFSMGLKILGLPADWQTTLRIVRIIQHEKLKQHFFVCPACGHPNEVAAGQRPGVAPSDTHHAESTPARCAAATKSSLPGRATKLYLPLCTPREYEDAQRAHLWLQSHPRTITYPNRPLTPEAAALIARYSELFPTPAGRLLRCGHCLGLRYGEVKRLQPSGD